MGRTSSLTCASQGAMAPGSCVAAKAPRTRRPAWPWAAQARSRARAGHRQRAPTFRRKGASLRRYADEKLHIGGKEMKLGPLFVVFKAKSDSPSSPPPTPHTHASPVAGSTPWRHRHPRRAGQAQMDEGSSVLMPEADGSPRSIGSLGITLRRRGIRFTCTVRF